MLFGDAMRVMRSVRATSQEGLAAKCGINMWTITRAETGRVNLTDYEKLLIRVALDWPESTDELLGRVFSAKWENK